MGHQVRMGGSFRSLNGGNDWSLVTHSTLPEAYDRVPVVLFANGCAWIATEKGQVFQRGRHQR